MFSIGILGFLVWSLFPFSSLKVVLLQFCCCYLCCSYLVVGGLRGLLRLGYYCLVVQANVALVAANAAKRILRRATRQLLLLSLLVGTASGQAYNKGYNTNIRLVCGLPIATGFYIYFNDNIIPQRILEKENMVALPYCEIGVINFAVCWKSLVFKGTFSCKNLLSYTRSAGNLLITKGLKSSSETTRETSFNFTLFNERYKTQIGCDAPNYNWLVWFVGFSEGDGAILTYKGIMRYVLTQKESAILCHIQQVLGFGVVRHFDNFSRFIVNNPKDILLLFFLFNGNLVLHHRKSQLNQWFQILRSYCKYGQDLTLINELVLPALSDAWLSGFTDAEGCFNVNIVKRINTSTGYRVTLRFILDQKNAQSLLLQIRELFGFGQVFLRKEIGVNEVYRYNVNTYMGLITIRNYFLTYPLKTKKGESFNK